MLSEPMKCPKRFVGTYRHTCSHTDILSDPMKCPKRFVGAYLHTCSHTDILLDPMKQKKCPKRFVGTYLRACNHTDILLNPIICPKRFVSLGLETYVQMDRIADRWRNGRMKGLTCRHTEQKSRSKKHDTKGANDRNDEQTED